MRYSNVTWLYRLTTVTNPNPNPKPSYSKSLVPAWSEHHHHKKQLHWYFHLSDRVQSGVVNVHSPRQQMPSVPQRFCRLCRCFDMSNVAIFGNPSCVLPPTDGLSWDDLRKILHVGRRMAILQNGVERLSKISTGWVGWVGCTNVTDRQTDDNRRQTELQYQIPERNVVTFG